MTHCYYPTKVFLKKIGNYQIHWLIKDTDIQFDATPLDIYIALMELNGIYHTCEIATLFDFVNELGLEDEGLYLSFDPRSEDLEQGWCYQCFECDDRDQIDLADKLEVIDDENGPTYVLEFSRRPCRGVISCINGDVLDEECS